MPWTLDRWPPEPRDALDTDFIINEVRAALAERDGLVQAGYVPDEFGRWDPLRGTPTDGDPAPAPTVANFQFEIQEMLDLTWPLRWWDAALCDDLRGTVRDGQPVGPRPDSAHRQ
jgi:hypothetical protein